MEDRRKRPVQACSGGNGEGLQGLPGEWAQGHTGWRLGAEAGAGYTADDGHGQDALAGPVLEVVHEGGAGGLVQGGIGGGEDGQGGGLGEEGGQAEALVADEGVFVDLAGAEEEGDGGGNVAGLALFAEAGAEGAEEVLLGFLLVAAGVDALVGDESDGCAGTEDAAELVAHGGEIRGEEGALGDEEVGRGAGEAGGGGVSVDDVEGGEALGQSLGRGAQLRVVLDADEGKAALQEERGQAAGSAAHIHAELTGEESESRGEKVDNIGGVRAGGRLTRLGAEGERTEIHRGTLQNLSSRRLGEGEPGSTR